MAATQPAIDRILFLIGERDTERTTPNTITRCGSGIQSYEMPIAWKEGEDWIVTNEKSSVTTNRHINAAHRAISNLPGFTAKQEETQTKRRRPYGMFEEVTFPVTRYTKGGK